MSRRADVDSGAIHCAPQPPILAVDLPMLQSVGDAAEWHGRNHTLSAIESC
jgi:hypothetical protein